MKKAIILSILFLGAQLLIAQNWTGTYTSSFGELRLIQVNNKVYGDYGNLGSIEGTIAGKTLTGTFTNRSKKGTIEWTRTDNGFTGTWKYPNMRNSMLWKGTRTSSKRPKLTSSIKRKVTKDALIKRPDKKQLGQLGTVYNRKITLKKNPRKLLKINHLLKTGDAATLEVVNNQFNDNIEYTPKANDGKETEDDNENCVISNKKVDVGTATFSFLSENGSPIYMMPGNMFHYKSILDGDYKLIRDHRNPINLFITDAKGANATTTARVDAPHSTSELNAAVNTLASGDFKNVPANMSFELKEISSVKELGFSLTGSYSNKAARIAASVGLTTKSKQESYFLLVKFQQAMYNISVDDNISETIFKNEVSNTTDMVYVSTVTYGRKGFLLVKTSKSLKDIKANLGLNYNGTINKGKIDATFNYLKKDASAEVKLLMYGGNGDAAAKSVTKLLEDVSKAQQSLVSYIEGGAGEPTTALPIAYQIKNLKGEQLGLKSAFDITTETCIPKKAYKLKVNFSSIKNFKSDDRDKRDDYCIEFEPQLEIDGVTYIMKDKEYNSNRGTHNSRFGINNNSLFAYDAVKNQIAVREGSREFINNSGVFYLPENVELSKAKLSVKFRIWEASGVHNNGKPKLNRLEGVSKSGSYNYHNFDLSEVMQVLNRAKTVDEKTFTKCNKCNYENLGNYGSNRYYIGNSNTVPMVNSGEKTKPILSVVEYMRNSPKSREVSINYTFELVD